MDTPVDLERVRHDLTHTYGDPLPIVLTPFGYVVRIEGCWHRVTSYAVDCRTGDVAQRFQS